MNERMLCLTFAIVFVYPPIKAQWQTGVPVASPETIRVSVGGNSAQSTLPGSPPAAAPVTGPGSFPANILDLVGAPPAQAGRRTQTAMPNAFFNQMFGNGFYDEVWSDRTCGMSRMLGASLWGPEIMGTMRFACNCRMLHDNINFQNVDLSPRAMRDCMTSVTGVVCCII